MREEEAPVSSAALTKLSLSPWISFVITVWRNDTCGGVCLSTEGVKFRGRSTVMKLGAVAGVAELFEVFHELFEVFDELFERQWRSMLCFPLHSLNVKVEEHSEVT